MRYKVCAIRDRAADVFGLPMFFQSVGVAVRSFTDEVNRNAENNNLNKHPEDFDLFLLGEFDDNEAVFECERPQQICVGKDVKL